MMKCPVCGLECDKLFDLEPVGDEKVCNGCYQQARQGVDTVLRIRRTYLNTGFNAQHT